MRARTTLTTIVTVGALATAGTAAVASAARQNDPTCDGARAGQRSGQPATQGRHAQQGRHGRTGARALPRRTNAAPLSTAEAAAVTYMREEEKLARDVYRKLADSSGNPVFTRIAASEQRHMDALGRIITRYGLTDPAKGKAAGQFENQTLQRLYDELVAKGSASPAAAIAVGRTIEKLDIADLDKREAASKHTDVRWVFEQLERGSKMHLRAFTMQTT